MEKAIWQMQQEAEMRVQQMRERSRRLVEQNHRSEASLRAAREAVEAMAPRASHTPSVPQKSVLPSHSARMSTDPERTLLLALALLLQQCGGRPLLVLALLYLAL